MIRETFAASLSNTNAVVHAFSTRGNKGLHYRRVSAARIHADLVITRSSVRPRRLEKPRSLGDGDAMMTRTFPRAVERARAPVRGEKRFSISALDRAAPRRGLR